MRPAPCEPKIFGTWDFKWPQGKEIRVAFQDLPACVERWDYPALRELIAQLEHLAQQWTNTGANIGFSFRERDKPRVLPAPAAASGSKLFGRSQSEPNREAPVEYDVLVSFAPLPLWFRDSEGEDVPVTGQTTVLGSYATRVDYGIPSMLLGPNTHHLGKHTARDYFQSDPYRHIALHELGHALGLAHGHQNPLYRAAQLHRGIDIEARFKSPQAIKAELRILQATYKTEFSGAGEQKLKDEIAEELQGVWPHAETSDPGTIPFSDWIDIDLEPNERLENRTVMAHPRWSNFFRNEVNEPPHVVHELGDFDKSILREMYPRPAR